MNTARYTFRRLATAMTCIVGSMFTACDKYVDFKDVILVTGTETNNLVKFTVESTPASYSVTATATGKVTQDVTVNFEVDTDLIEQYNEAMDANYSVPPEGSYTLSSTTGVIKAGTNVSEPVTVRIASMDNFVDGRIYMIPVTIIGVDGPLPVLESSRTIYLKVARVFEFNSVDIADYNFYATYHFDEALTNITAFTYEIKCYVNDWHSGSNQISRLCNWGPVNEAYPNLLRFGEAGSKVNQLQWVSAEGSAFSKTEFALDTWYTISCVYDGTSYKMYVDGVLDMNFAGAGQAYELGALELGMSYDGYENAQRFLGRIAEVRFWNRPLSATEIQGGLCGVDSEAEGLVAYWKLNEGSGDTFHDITGGGRDMAWPVPVVWNSDDTNKCAQ